jgi:hypothetical protein
MLGRSWRLPASAVVVSVDKRIQNPYLVAARHAEEPTPMPWFGAKRLVIRFS